MKNSINLIDYKNKPENESNTGIQRTARIIAVSLLFFVSVLSVILFILIVFSPLPELKKQENNTRAILSQSRRDIAKLAYIKERTDHITEIIDKRSEFDKTMEQLLSVTPPDVEINKMVLKDNTVSVTIISESLESVDQYLNQVIKLSEEKKEFSNVTLTSFSAIESSNTFLVSISLNTL